MEIHICDQCRENLYENPREVKRASGLCNVCLTMKDCDIIQHHHLILKPKDQDTFYHLKKDDYDKIIQNFKNIVTSVKNDTVQNIIQNNNDKSFLETKLKTCEAKLRKSLKMIKDIEEENIDLKLRLVNKGKG